MELAPVISIAYGVMAGLGGVLGYVKAGSQTSLFSGSLSGILLVISGIAQQQGATWGLPLAIGMTILLILVFAVRFAKTRKLMPSGLMVIAGSLALVGLWL